MKTHILEYCSENKMFPKNPLAALIWILRNRRIPTDIEFGFLLEMIAENSYAGEESDGCGDGVPEDSEQYDSSEESVWLQTPLLDRHVMRHSNYITGSRSGTASF